MNGRAATLTNQLCQTIAPSADLTRKEIFKRGLLSHSHVVASVLWIAPEVSGAASALAST